MKRIFLRALGACMVLAALVSCGGGGGGGGDATPAPTPTPTTGTISGTVNNSSNGAALQGITVTAGGATATTDASGNFTLSSVPAGSAVVLFNSTSFAEQSKTVTVTGGATSSINVLMVPVTLTEAFTPTSAYQSSAIAGSSARLNVPANSLRTSTGGAPTGQVTARITPISPAANPNLMPGEFTISAGGGTSQIESFGALAATFTDANGNVLTTLASGQTATVRIPVSSRATNPPATIPLMFFNPTTGMWVQEGTATLNVPGQYYEGTVTHFTTWNADQVYNTTNVTVCVRDAANQPVSGVRVTSDGIDYTGAGSGYTNSQGSAVVAMKRGGTAAFTATSGTRVSNTVSITTSSTATTFTQSTCLVLAAANTGNITIKLTWGANPADLDSHLRGPGNTHVYYISQGSLTAVPFASLDVDDVTSFGPEVVTISRLSQGTYRYYVHHFFGTGTIATSGARVELRNGGQTQIFTPPSSGSAIYWHVFNIVVDSSCNVTIQSVNTLVGSEPLPVGNANYCNTTVQPTKPELDAYAAQLEKAKASETDVKP